MRRRLSGAPAVPFLKSYIVFNVEQIAGLPEHYYAKPGAKRPEPQRIEHAEQFFAATKADIRHGGPRAFYSPAGDFIKRCCTISFCGWCFGFLRLSGYQHSGGCYEVRRQN